MSNLGLYKACDREGIHYEKTAVGDKYVCENMMTYGHSLGGEQSGHIIFSKHATTGDGILTSLMVMEVMLEKKQPLSVLASEVVIYPQLLKNVRVANKQEARENSRVQEVVRSVGEQLGEDGRILVRESGTEPVIRVMVEAENDAICQECADRVIRVMTEERFDCGLRGTVQMRKMYLVFAACLVILTAGCGSSENDEYYEDGIACMEKE